MDAIINSFFSFQFELLTLFFVGEREISYIIIRPCGPAEIKLKIVTRVKIDVDWSPLANNFQLVPRAHTVAAAAPCRCTINWCTAAIRFLLSVALLARSSITQFPCVSCVCMCVAFSSALGFPLSSIQRECRSAESFSESFRHRGVRLHAQHCEYFGSLVVF